MAKQQPGVMFYFEVRQCLKRLNLEEKGALFEAILDYGEHDVVPTFDGSLGVAWDFIQPRIDKDKARYNEVSRKRAEAANERWSKGKNVQTDANADFAMQTVPTTTPTPLSTSISSPAPAEWPGQGARGDPLGRSSYNTSEAEFNRLRNDAISKLKGCR